MENSEKPRKLMTLCVVHQHPRVLLGMKKRGFGAGRWNGFGGKVEPGETIEDAAVREVAEETGLQAMILEKQGIIEFEFRDDPKVLEVHIFKIENFKGEPAESEEMKPQWFNIDEIPFSQMWSDDHYWFPYFLKGRKFRGRFLFDKPATADYAGKILEKSIEAVDEI